MSSQHLRQMNLNRCLRNTPVYSGLPLVVALLLLVCSAAFAAPNPSQSPIPEPELSGLAHERDLNYAAAVVSYQKEVVETEEALSAYDIALHAPLMGLARSLEKLGEQDAAVEAAKRAQHIGHRFDGVQTKMQLEAIELMTRIHLRAQKPMLADKQQKFAYFIRTAGLEPDSLELLPAIEKLSHWFETTGQLARSRKLNQRGIDLIEAQLGENSVEQLPYLQRLAKLKRLQRVCCSTRIMNRALEIIEANPAMANDLKAEVYLELADAHTISGNKKSAQEYYKNAWDLLRPKDREALFATPKKIAFSRPLGTRISSTTDIYRRNRDVFGNNELEKLQDEEIRQLPTLPPQEFVLNESIYDIRIRDRDFNRDFEQEKAVRTIGQPFTFLRTQFLQLLPNRLHSDQALASLDVELQFDIDGSGRPRNIEVLSPNTPPKVGRLMYDVIRKSRFRPRMAEGNLVATNQFKLNQSFATRAEVTDPSVTNSVTRRTISRSSEPESL